MTVLVVSYKTQSKPAVVLIKDAETLASRLETLGKATNVESITVFRPTSVITRETSLTTTPLTARS